MKYAMMTWGLTRLKMETKRIGEGDRVKMKQKIFKFKKGQLLCLDDIYDFQAIPVGHANWWKSIEEGGDEIIILKDIEIIISWKVRDD